MRVLVAVGCTLLASAGVTLAQPADGRRSIVDVVEEDVNGRAPRSRSAVNDAARAKLERGDTDGAVSDLRDAVARGEADVETHYMLAGGLLNQAKALREQADAAAARGDQAEAARLRSRAEGLIGEALGFLGRGRDYAYTILDERLASGDAEGARNLASALLRVDPSDARARDAMTRATTGTGGSSPWGGSSGRETITNGGGNPSAASVWDRYGSDPNSVWDRAVANANRATSPTSDSTWERAVANANRTTTTPTATTPTTTTPTTTTPTTTTPEQPEESPRLGRPGIPAPALGPGRTVSEADLEVLARIVKGEALVCSFEGKVAVAAVVLNRVVDSRWPNTIPGVAHQPLQFSCYNRNYRQQLYYGPVPEECFRAARAALNGEDPTGNATHYYNPFLVSPPWARNLRRTRQIGTTRTDAHVFYR